MSEWREALLEAGGRVITWIEFLAAWKPHCGRRESVLREALAYGRSHGSRVRSLEFRWHPMYGDHVVLAVESHTPIVGVMELEAFTAVPGVTGQNPGETATITPCGLDGKLGALVFGWG